MPQHCRRTHRVSRRPTPGLRPGRRLVLGGRVGVRVGQRKHDAHRVLVGRSVAAHFAALGWQQAAARDEGIKGKPLGRCVIVVFLRRVVVVLLRRLETLQKGGPVDVLDGLDGAFLL